MIKKIEDLITKTNSILWLNTKEYDRIDRILIEISRRLNYDFISWDSASDICDINGEKVAKDSPFDYLEDISGDIIYILRDIDVFLKDQKVWRKLLTEGLKASERGVRIVLVSPNVEIPNELENYISVVDVQNPTEIELTEILKNSDMKKKDIKKAVSYGRGLSEFEFINAINLSDGIDGIFEQKKEIIEKGGLLSVSKTDNKLSDMYGIDKLKDFVLKMAKSGKGKGVLLLGVAGSGKTEFAKRVGNELEKITISLDLGDLMGKYVGETEQNTKKAFQTINAMSPAIVFIDEIEKGLSATGNDGDSVGIRQGAQFLKWMQDNSGENYVIATANDVSKLPPEYLRSGRWDAIFFMDIPNAENRQKILNLYREKYKIEDTLSLKTSEYTGAEIETLCRIASSLDIKLKDATKFLCPIFVSNRDKIKELRTQAKMKFCSAN